MIQVKRWKIGKKNGNCWQTPAFKGRVLLMKDGGQPVGYVIVDLEERTLHLRKLSVQGYGFTAPPQGESVFILDTLMRSAASYGEDHGDG